MTGKKIVRIETVSSNIILPLSMTALHYFAPLKIGKAEAASVPYRPLTWAITGYTVHHHITDKRVSFSQRILKLANRINLLLIVSMND